MKKLLSVFITFCVLFSMVQMTLGLSVSAGGDTLTPAQIAAKNYPVPANFEVSQVFTLDSSGCTEEGCFYDTACKKITSSGGTYTNVLPSKGKLDGSGFMFWYKSTNGGVIRIRKNNSQTGSILLEANLSACSEGRWVTYYFYGQDWENISPKTDAEKDIRKYIGDDDEFYITYLNWSGGTTYFDEFFTFKPVTTVADTYDNDKQAFKFSIKRMSVNSKTIQSYIAEEGAVELTSAYGEEGADVPINITYNADPEQFAKAVAIAKEGSGYLKINVSDIVSQENSGSDAYTNIVIKFGGIDKVIDEYIYGAGTNDDFLLKVSDLENPEDITTISITVKGNNIKNVDFKFSAITVWEQDSDKIFLQAEDLNGVFAENRTAEPTALETIYDKGKNRTYINVAGSNTSRAYVEFTLPELEVGEYQLGASIYMKTTKGKFAVTVNNLNTVYDVEIGDNVYTSYPHNSYIENLCKIKITKNYSDGASKLKFSAMPWGANQIMCIDYFTLKKVGSLTAEPSSNFKVKDYPEIENYEVKTVIDNYDNFIAGNDYDVYKPIGNKYIVYGYVGDGNAYNLNSKYVVNADIPICYLDDLDGDGLRFWHKSNYKFWLTFYSGNTKIYDFTVEPSTGEWSTLLYKNIEFKQGYDFDDVTSLNLITGGKEVYFDELHTIQQKQGDIVYSINGNTAYVSGYNLRLEDVEIASTYQGLPVTAIADGALANSSTLKSVVLPSSVTSIGNEAFSGCKKLQSINLGSNITSIGANAFSGCTGLLAEVANNSVAKNYVINNGINYRCNNGIFDYKKLGSSVKIVEYVGSAKNVTVPATIDSVTVDEILENAFKDNTNIVSVSMSTVITIGDEAFSGCTSLESVNLGSAITTIGNKSFENVTSLSEITLPESITSMKSDTFKNCYDTIIANVVKDSYAYTYVNTKATAMTQIPDTTSAYKYSLYKYKATVISYSGSDTILEIPEEIDGYSVVSIGEGAFKNNTKITYVSFPDKCKNIYKEAFSGCTSLKNFDINNVLYIDHLGFAYDTSLTNITLTNITKYENDTFLGCDLNIEIKESQFTRTALELSQSWHVGINLGNIFDWTWSYDYSTYHSWQHDIPSQITKERIDFITSSGFDVIRFPISWMNYTDDSNNYKIDDEYLSAVKDVVDYAIDDGAYIIINVHHDTLKWLNLSNYSDEQIEKFTRIWEQIAEYFKNYDEHLIFESLNEERYLEDWDGNGSSGGIDLFNKFNNIQKAFYNTVRDTGGNNELRYLMLETYAAQAKENHYKSVWYPNLDEDDHIMMSIHLYTDPENYSWILPKAQEYFNDKGIPCILGEAAHGRMSLYDASHPYTQEEYDEENKFLEEWSKGLFEISENCGIKVILWEDGGSFGMINHSKYKWDFPLEIQAIMDTVYSENEKLDASISMTMQEGASIRLGEVNGIRFTTQVDVAKIEELRSAGYTVEIGTLIGPKDAIGDDLDYDDYINSNAVKVPYKASDFYNGSTNIIAGSLANILEKTKSNSTSGNIAREFVGRGYAIVTDSSGNKFYSYANYYNNDITNNTRSVAYIAFMYQNDENSSYYQLPEAQKETVDRWAGFYEEPTAPYIENYSNDPAADDIF